MVKDLSPLVSVVMAVYNGESFLKDAVDSILSQTLNNFELLVINDGSSDKTKDILAGYSDKRLRVYDQTNKGLVVSLNRAVGLAKGRYIARQDADDLSSSGRLEKQLAFLEANPEVVIVGSSMSVIDDSGHKIHEHRVLLNDPELKQELLMRSPFAHGSVMFTKAAFVKAGGYKQDDWPAEDYGLWLHMANEGLFANIDEPLYAYRENMDSISSKNFDLQEQKKHILQEKAWRKHRQLQPKKIDTATYVNLEMGQLRIERITHNLTSVLRKSLRKFNFFAAGRTKIILLSDKGLRRKYARLIAVKLRLKSV